MARLFVVTQDGRPLQRGLTEERARAYAKKMEEGMERHVAGTKLRVPAFDIVPDREIAAWDNALYKDYKATR